MFNMPQFPEELDDDYESDFEEEEEEDIYDYSLPKINGEEVDPIISTLYPEKGHIVNEDTPKYIPVSKRNTLKRMLENYFASKMLNREYKPFVAGAKDKYMRNFEEYEKKLIEELEKVYEHIEGDTPYEKVGNLFSQLAPKPKKSSSKEGEGEGEGKGKKKAKKIKLPKNGEFQNLPPNYFEDFVDYDHEGNAELDKSRAKILEKLLLLLKTNTFSSATESKVLKESESGDIIRDVRLIQPRDMARLSPRELAHPMLLYKFFTGQLVVPKRYEAVNKKKRGIIIIDQSGSMISEEKLTMVRAVLLKYALDLCDDFEFYAGRFVEQLDDLVKFTKDNRKEAIEFALNYKIHGGGTTYVYDVVKKLVEGLGVGTVLVGEKLVQFEAGFKSSVIVVNDGQDDIEATNIFYPVHAITLEVSNERLKELCLSSGGTYNEFK